MIFTFIFLSLLSFGFCWGITYLTTRAQTSAIKTDFDGILKRLEDQTLSVKNIEEGIIHGFVEKRELAKIKRQKIELAYTATIEEQTYLTNRFIIAIYNKERDYTQLPHELHMLLVLYFDDCMKAEISSYLKEKEELLEITRTLSDKKVPDTVTDEIAYTNKLKEDNIQYLRNYVSSLSKIQDALTDEMSKLNEPLTSKNKG